MLHAARLVTVLFVLWKVYVKSESGQTGQMISKNNAIRFCPFEIRPYLIDLFINSWYKIWPYENSIIIIGITYPHATKKLT